ncbi:uncharacterized protein LOC144903286 isoform X1 [Branchiostoma floridae x Branchiostoma belcheri]
MPKKGQSDAHWRTVMRQYAMGVYKFTTGKFPKGRRWREEIAKIRSCPKFIASPEVHSDVLGRAIQCTCGYPHKTSTPISPETPTATTTAPTTEFEQTTRETTSVPPSSTAQTSQSLSSPLQSRTRPDLSTSPKTTTASSDNTTATAKAQSTVVHASEQTSSITTESPATPETVVTTPSTSTLETTTKHTVSNSKTLPMAKRTQLPTVQVATSSCEERTVPTDTTVQNSTQGSPTSRSTTTTQSKKTHQSKSSKDGSGLPAVPSGWETFLPKKLRNNISPADQAWIAQCLYDHNGRLRETLPNQNWYHPPSPHVAMSVPPDPHQYFRQRMFLWAPMRMWRIPLNCPKCQLQLSHSGIYTRAREVVDIDSRYYLVSLDYPRCNHCKVPFCPWSSDILNQLDPYHRSLFPAVLTKYQALDKKCITLMKPRTQGNSSSLTQQALEEVHSEEWGRRCLQYLSDCEIHKKGARLTGLPCDTVYQAPPAYRPLPLAQWFEAAHTNEIFGHEDEMRAIITSTYGRVLKLDSTKKVTKKLAGDVACSASWMTNISNETGEVLNSVLTTGEGAGLQEVCQGIVRRYSTASEPPPDVIYVDRDCCSQTGDPPVLKLFQPWRCHVKLDIFHFLRRFSKGLTTEHHPLYGTFCSKLSSCLFVWDKGDYEQLREAKRGELRNKNAGQRPSEKQVTAAITANELARHCRRMTRPVEHIRQLINQLLKEMWELTDTSGVPLISKKTMENVWAVQQKHLPCIVDPQGVNLYTITGYLEKGGKRLNVLRCARGSSSVESFHRHQCAFIPGWRANACHTQMYMIEGGSRWNINRAREAVQRPVTSKTRLYDVRLMSNINTISQRVLGVKLLPEFSPPGKPTDELMAIQYLLAQSARGDLTASVVRDDDVGSLLPELVLEEADEEDLLDVTVCLAEHIWSGNQVTGVIEPTASRRKASASATTDSAVTATSSATRDHTAGATSSATRDHTASATSSATRDHTASATSSATRDHTASATSSATTSQDAQGSRDDAQGVPGWDAVDNLAAYLLSLDLSATALSAAEAKNIVALYAKLSDCDKGVTKYKRKAKRGVVRQGSMWRASRKRDAPTPGVQGCERLYMAHGQAAQCPSTNRISECVCLRLLRTYSQVRNRPEDAEGRKLPLPQSIVQTYSNIQQLLADNRMIQEDTNIVLVVINNTTVSAWVSKRQKRMDREALLQGTSLPDSITTSEEPLASARQLPEQETSHGHEEMAFPEPENRQDQSAKRPRKSAPRGLPAVPHPQGHAVPPPQSHAQGPGASPPPQPPFYYPGPWASAAPQPQPYMPGYPSTTQPQPYMPGYPSTTQPQPYMPGYPSTTQPPPYLPGYPPMPWYGWPYCIPPAPPSSTETPSPSDEQQSSRQREWRHKKAALEDQERMARGEPPKKRHKKDGGYRYICTMCRQQKSKATGHTQVKGKWYCPSLGISVEDWKEQMKNE